LAGYVADLVRRCNKDSHTRNLLSYFKSVLKARKTTYFNSNTHENDSFSEKDVKEIVRSWAQVLNPETEELAYEDN
jgi:hypothetical protein